jgi:hypothetical protein
MAMLKDTKSLIRGSRVFVRKKVRTPADIEWLIQRGYGVQDGGRKRPGKHVPSWCRFR